MHNDNDTDNEHDSERERELDPIAAPTTPSRKWVRRLLPLVILAAGAATTVALVKLRKPPPRKPRVDNGVLVRVVRAHAERRTVQVSANGVVQPRREVTIAPEINGRVKWTSPALVVGGLAKRGTPLLVIDGADYKLAIERSRAQVAQAERALAEAESASRVARREWNELGKRPGGDAPAPLTLHKPQLHAAQAQLQGARADLDQSKLNLARTVIRAPFNLRVRSKMVDLGQYVRVGQTLATVYDTDVAEVIVSLPSAELRWLKVPDAARTVAQSTPQGPRVSVHLRTGHGDYPREGTLVRSVGEVDPSGRMSKVVVAITDPFYLERATDAPYQPALELGAFVEVRLPGKSLQDVFVLPAEALRLGSVVWLAGADQRLIVRPVTLVRRTEREVLIAGGLKEGDLVVMTHVSGAVDGLKLRIRGAEDSAPQRPERVTARPPASGERAEVTTGTSEPTRRAQ